MKRWPSRLLLALLGGYRRWISPAFPRRCKYHPTCSAYAAQAIRELGPFRGAVVAAWRLLRCNPLSDGGIDDLADRRLFRGVSPVRGSGEPPPSGGGDRPTPGHGASNPAGVSR